MLLKLLLKLEGKTTEKHIIIKNTKKNLTTKTRKFTTSCCVG